MCCLAEHTCLAILQQVLQRLIAACAVRVENVARLLIALLHGSTYLLVLVCSAADETGDSLVAALIEVIYAGKVAWVTHVHSIGQGLLRWLRIILACLQVVVKNVVGIVGSNETLYRQSHGVAEEGCTDVAEVTAWHTHHHVVSLTESLHAGIGIEVIECLWQETCHIDRVGRGELHVIVEVGIHES